MSKKATVVLAILVAALACYVALFERGSLSSKELEERKGKVLTSFVRDKVMRLTLTRKGQKVVLERQRADDAWSPWQMLAPARSEADQEAVDQLLGELEWLSARRLLESVSDKDLQSFGLKEPAFRVEFHVAGDDHVLKLGAPDVHGESHYAQVDDQDTVYVVPKTLLETLDQEPSHFRTKQFLGDITAAWVQRIELTHQAEKQLLQKQDGRWWYMGNPKGYADAKRVNELIEELDTLRAVRYLEGSAKAAALSALQNANLVDVRVMPDQHREDKQPERVLLRLGGPCAGHEAERYAQAGDKGDPVCVRGEDVSAFEVGQQELRLARLFAFDVSEIEQLELKGQGARLLLKRDGEKWSGEGVEAPDRESVEAWLSDLASEDAGEVLPLSPLREDVTLTLTLVENKREVVHAHLDEGAQVVKVWRDGEPLLLTFSWTLADRLSVFSQRFVSLEPWARRQPSQVVGIEARDGALRRTLELHEGAWRAPKARQEVADGERVRELVRALIKLRALAVVSDQVRAGFALDKPRAELVLRLNEGGQTLSLQLGASTPRGAYARIAGLVYEVGPEVERALAALASGRVETPEAGLEAKADAAAPSEDDELDEPPDLHHHHDHH